MVPELQAAPVVRATRGVDRHTDGHGRSVFMRCGNSRYLDGAQCVRSTVGSQQASMGGFQPSVSLAVYHGNVCDTRGKLFRYFTAVQYRLRRVQDFEKVLGCTDRLRRVQDFEKIC